MHNPETPEHRNEHLNECIGCQFINQHRTSRESWITCYEHANRNSSAVTRLLDLYNYDRNATNYNYPMIPGTQTINLLSLVDDIARRFQKGTLVAGETSAND